MAANLFTATGTKVSIAAAAQTEPANAAAYTALTWTEIGLVESIGDYGDAAAVVTGAVLADGRMRKAKGARDAGTTNLVLYPDAADVGQVALEAAEATNFKYPIRVVLPNRLNATGADELNYFMAAVSSKRRSVGGNDNIVRDTYSLALDSKITKVAPTAGA